MAIGAGSAGLLMDIPLAMLGAAMAEQTGMWDAAIASALLAACMAALIALGIRGPR